MIKKVQMHPWQGASRKLALTTVLINSGSSNRFFILDALVALATAIGACGRLKSLLEGRKVHEVARNINDARAVFYQMPSRDAISWTTIVRGYVKNGEFNEGLKLFRLMNFEGEGRFYFNCIREPQVEHYALLVVTLLVRVGLFDEARIFIEEHGIERHTEVQKALLDGCRIYRHTKTCKRAIEQLCNSEPLNAENYVLLSNLYASSAKWDMVDKCLMKIMKEEEGYVPNADFSLHNVDEERECIPIGHSEMLAIYLG
ncbi:hypothetical protein HHK36_007689 [Tetracentron sinense]|uniref:Pentatricopeptide repeat-containing protein n=1 Tax=Tetracentron sinense TaxID=13715 RepID=A0A834ZNV8_TETSI|nr:hypothetical protein HHK36_007689 [Tetracentron sinense]